MYGIVSSLCPFTAKLAESTKNYMGKFLWTLFQMVCVCAVTVAGVFVIKNGVHAPVPREIIVEVESVSDTLLPSKTVYRATEPTIDSDGFLNIPNNTVISDITTNRIRTEKCSFDIPMSWVGNVAIHVMEMNQEDAELYDMPVLNTEVIQFYELNTYKKYQTQEYVYTDGASRMGKITELYITDAYENDLTDKKNNPRQLYVGDITNRSDENYAVFLYQLSTDDVIDDEFRSRYLFMRESDYAGCIISTLASEYGELNYANSYIRYRYADNFDPNGQGMTEEFPEEYEGRKNVMEAPTHGEAPDGILASVSAFVPYDWKSFTTPWMYSDHGSSYPYAAMESGGMPVIVESTPAPSVDIDLDVSTGGTANTPVEEAVEDDVMVFSPEVEEAPEETEEYEEDDEDVYVFNGDTYEGAEEDITDLTMG